MGSIVNEIDTIGDLITPVASFTRSYKQELPAKYVANTYAIRWQGDNPPTDLTATTYETSRPYQILYFGNNEVDCLTKAQAIQTALQQHIKVKLRGLNEYITLSPFAFSAPYKTDVDGVYAVVGVLVVSDFVNRTQPSYTKMGRIEAEIKENGGGN